MSALGRRNERALLEDQAIITAHQAHGGAATRVKVAATSGLG